MRPVFPYLMLGALTLGLTLCLTLLARSVARRAGDPEGLGRKIFHVGVFTAAVPAQLWLGFWGVVLYGSLLAVVVGVASRRGARSALYRTLAREGDGEERGRLVLVSLLATALGGLLSVLLVGPFAVVGYLVCGWGDGAGEVVGRRWGRRPYRLSFFGPRGPVRTLEGSLAVLGVGFLGGWAGLDLLGHAAPAAVGAGLLAGSVGAATEAVSGRGTDNLWMQLSASLVAWWVLG